MPQGLPGDLADLSVVHGAEDRRITHPLTDPQLNADAGVEEEHGGQGQQEKSHHDEGGVHLPLSQRAPSLVTANVRAIVQEVVFDLGRGGISIQHVCVEVLHHPGHSQLRLNLSVQLEKKIRVQHTKI